MTSENKPALNHEVHVGSGGRAFLKSLFRRVAMLLSAVFFTYGRITVPSDSDLRLGDFGRMEQQDHILDATAMIAALGRIETPLTTPHGSLPPDPFLGDAYLKEFDWFKKKNQKKVRFF